MTYVEHVYEIINEKCGKLDAIYEDYIESLIGTIGMHELIKNRYLESCGIINGRKLYSLINITPREGNKL